MLTKFGELCRNYRAKSGLYLGDQAEGTKLSVSAISAIERGDRSIPENYALQVAKWLVLDPIKTKELILATALSTNVIKFRPRNEKAAKLAFALTRRLNEMTPTELEKIRILLEEGVDIYV